MFKKPRFLLLVVGLTVLQSCATQLWDAEQVLLDDSDYPLSLESELSPVDTLTESNDGSHNKTVEAVIYPLLHDVQQMDVRDPTDAQGNVTVNVDMVVKRSLEVPWVKTESFVVGANVTVQEVASALEVQSQITRTTEMLVIQIKSPSGPVTVNADLHLKGMTTSNTLHTSFLQIDSEHQWALSHHDDFSTEASLEGWSHINTTRCDDAADHFLGGHCHFAADEVSKTFGQLMQHTHVRVTASFHMLGLWDGEVAFLKVDGRIAWVEHGYRRNQSTIGICGRNQGDTRLAIPLDITMPHTGSEVMVSFGSTLEGDACTQSWGIDDVSLYIR